MSAPNVLTLKTLTWSVSSKLSRPGEKTFLFLLVYFTPILPVFLPFQSDNVTVMMHREIFKQVYGPDEICNCRGCRAQRGGSRPN